MSDASALYFPIRLRCVAASDLLGSAGLEVAIARALKRCFARARAALPASVAFGGGVALHPPYLADGNLVGSDAQRLMLRIRRAIDAAAGGAALPIAGTDRVAPSPRGREISEKFDPARFDAASETYIVPSYDGGKARIGVDLGKAKTAAPDWASIAARLRNPASYYSVGSSVDFDAVDAVYEIRPLALAWDKYAIAMLMVGLRADGSGPTWLIMKTLRRLAGSDPRRFRSLLKELRKGYEGIHAATLKRGDDDILVTTASGSTLLSVLQLHDILGGLVYAAREIPEARAVAAEWEASARGLGRVAALLSALAEARAELIYYLLAPLGTPSPRLPPGPPTASPPPVEHTDPATLDALRQVSAGLLRYQAVTLIMADNFDEQNFIYMFQLDLIQNVHWIATTLSLVQQVDFTLQGLREAYGAALGSAEETKVLREIRADILGYATRPLPTAARAIALRAWGETRLRDWVGTAADRRLTNLGRQFARLSAEVNKLNIIASSDVFTDTDNEFNNTLDGFKAEVRQLGRDIAAKWAGARDLSYLKAANAVEHRAAIAAVRVTLLSVWRATIQIMSDPDWHHFGSQDDRRRWHRETESLRNEAKGYYAHPDISLFVTSHPGYVPEKIAQWIMRLDALADDIKDTVRRENNRRILISIGVLIVTAGVGAVLGALELSTSLIVLGEAATATALTAAGEHFILGKRVDIGDVISDFAGNVVTFGSFRVLNVAFAAVGARLFPGKALLQVATVFVGNVAVTTGLPVLLSYLDKGQWSDDLSSFLLTSLLIHTVGATISARSVLRQTRGPNPYDQLRDIGAAQAWLKAMPDFERELDALGQEMRTAVSTGMLDREKFASLQNRAAQLADRTEAGLRLLAGPAVTDAQLEALQIVPGLRAAEIRARLNVSAKLMSEYGAGVRAAPNVGQVGRLALPPPEALVPGELTIAGTIRGYNPDAPGMEPEKVADRLSRGGYTVKRDGAVLRLLPPGEDVPRYLMLPAAPDVPSAPLARLVTPEGPGAAKVLRTSRTNEAIGLRSLQAQTAVPGLEQVMTKIATTDPKSATDILKGLGRHFKPGAINNLAAVRAWQGIAHFLEIGGEPKHLATFLGGGKTAEVWRALGRFTTLRPTDLRGIQEIVSTNRNVLDRVVGIAGGFEEPNSVFAGLGLLASRTESGFDQLVEQLASSNAAERQQALDALVEGVGIVVRSPTRRLRFEMRSIDGEPVLSVRYPGGGAANVPGRFDDLVRRLSKPLPSGLNLFDGTPSDVVATVERMGQAKGGGFVDQAERAAFEKTVAHYRDMVTRLAQGVDVTRNAIGDRREIDTVASAIPAGGTVWASGNKIRVWVDPGLFELKPGMPLVNTPEKVGIQLDLGQRLSGELSIEEVTAAKLSLPKALRGLLSGGRVGQADWNDLKGGATEEEEASNRKWQQMIKMRAAALFAKRFLEAFRLLSGEKAEIELPEMVMRVGWADADAKAAAKQLGFRIETGKSR